MVSLAQKFLFCSTWLVIAIGCSAGAVREDGKGHTNKTASALEDCSPYVVNPDTNECYDYCRNDPECAPEAACDTTGGGCWYIDYTHSCGNYAYNTSPALEGCFTTCNRDEQCATGYHCSFRGYPACVP